MTPGGGSIGAALAGDADRASAPPDHPILLIVHFGDPRLAALQGVLGDLGYVATAVATPEEAIAAMQRGPLPDVLLTAHTTSSPRRGVGFARDCLARWPSLRTLYITFVPRPLAETPTRREVVLAAPFNAHQLADALAKLRANESAAP